MKLIIAVFTILLTSSAMAMELKYEGHSLSVEVPENWQLGKDLFGIPFTFFSPQENGQRSNITFAPTGAELELDVLALKKNQKDYQENKKKWTETHSARLNGFIPYRSYLNKNDHRVHTIGFSYTHRDKKYIENSFYLECKGKIIFSKSLRLEQNQPHQKFFEEMINGLDCGVI